MNKTTKINNSVNTSSKKLDKIDSEPTLEEMLARTPEGAFDLTDEDREFLSSSPVGLEIIEYE